MKKFLFIILLVLTSLVKGQPTCASTSTGGDIFYPNTVSTPTSAPTSIQYLCGPNTVVYDTISIGCLFVHVNTGSTLFYNKGCPQSIFGFVWLKNNSTLNILPGCPGLTVYYEPLAVINNIAAIPINSVACASVVFPAINCATGIDEINSGVSKIFSAYPNPSSSQIHIELLNFNNKRADISIFNQIGELVLERKDWNVSEKVIDVENLSIGLYLIRVKTNKGYQTERILINR